MRYRARYGSDGLQFNRKHINQRIRSSATFDDDDKNDGAFELFLLTIAAASATSAGSFIIAVAATEEVLVFSFMRIVVL